MLPCEELLQRGQTQMRLKGADAVEMEEEWKVSREPQTGEQVRELTCYTASQIQKGHGALKRPLPPGSPPNITESIIA